MDSLNISGSYRSYTEVLLEEIALEGLDGITLERKYRLYISVPETFLFS